MIEGVGRGEKWGAGDKEKRGKVGQTTYTYGRMLRIELRSSEIAMNLNGAAHNLNTAV